MPETSDVWRLAVLDSVDGGFDILDWRVVLADVAEEPCLVTVVFESRQGERTSFVNFAGPNSFANRWRRLEGTA